MSVERKPRFVYDELGRVLINGRYYYQPRGVLWEVVVDGVTHCLSEKNRFGHYPYSMRGSDWGQTEQLDEDEARWKTLEYAPGLFDLI